MNAILPIASYTNGVGFPIQFAYRPKATSFTGEACKTNRSLVRMESCWKTRVNARQAMSEGKSGPVETGLTGPVATALFLT